MSAARHSIAFYAFSPQGLTLGMRLARDMEGDLFAPDRLLRTTEEGGEHVPHPGLFMEMQRA